MESLNPQVAIRLRIAQVLTLSLLLLVALVGHRVEMQAAQTAPATSVSAH
jgi:hypothetical protein